MSYIHYSFICVLLVITLKMTTWVAETFQRLPRNIIKRQSSPIRGLEWLRGFQEVKVPRFHDNGTGWW